MNKFFLISQVFYPDEVSTANLFTILCRELVVNNTEVEVWAAQPSYTSSEKQPQKTSLNGFSIKYLPSTRFHKSNIIGRVFNILSFMSSAAIKLLLSRDKSTVFTHTTPPFLGILLSLICKIRKRKIVYIMLDIFPEGLIRLGKLSKNSPLTSLWNNMFKRSLKRSERVIVLGRDMRKFILNLSPELNNIIDYIPLWQDESIIKPIPFEENEFVKEHKLNGKFVVQYSGNMGLWNDMGCIGRACNKNLEGLNFLFIGGGMRMQELKEAIQNNNDKISFLPFQPGSRLSEALSACHISLVSLREGLEGMAVPSKIYGILASGRPVIALVPKESEIAYIVNEENCGIVVNPHSTDELVEAIIRLRGNEKLRHEMGSNARRAFELKYTTRIIAMKYHKILVDLNKQNN